jgi:hypothetical protein
MLSASWLTTDLGKTLEVAFAPLRQQNSTREMMNVAFAARTNAHI